MSEPEDLVNQIRPNILAGEIGGRVRPSRRRIVRLHNDATTSGRARCRLVLKRQRRDRRLDYRPTRLHVRDLVRAGAYGPEDRLPFSARDVAGLGAAVSGALTVVSGMRSSSLSRRPAHR